MRGQSNRVCASAIARTTRHARAMSAVAAMICLALPAIAQTPVLTLDPAWGSSETNVGVAVSALHEAEFRHVSDGDGGTLVVYEEYQESGAYGGDPYNCNADIVAKRLDGDGNVLWETVVCNAGGDQVDPRIVADPYQQSGWIIVWEDHRDHGGGPWDFCRPGPYLPGNSWVYAQSVSRDGIVGWAANGVAVAQFPGDQWQPEAISDWQGGAIITWYDDRNDSWNADVYAQRIDALGVPAWAADGMPVSRAPNTQRWPQIVPDGTGGAIIGWYDTRWDNMVPIEDDLYAQRLDPQGNPVWEADGVPVSLAPDGIDFQLQMEPDFAGGAMFAWEGQAPWPGSGPSFSNIYVQHVTESGDREWGEGLQLHADSMHQQTQLDITGDRHGGIICVWAQAAVGAYTNYSAWTQGIRPDGTRLWPSPIALAPGQDYQEHPQVCSDTIGGAIYSWQEPWDRNTNPQPDIYAAHIWLDGTRPYLARELLVSNRPTENFGPRIEPDREGGAIVMWNAMSRAIGQPVTPGDIIGHRLKLVMASTHIQRVKYRPGPGPQPPPVPQTEFVEIRNDGAVPENVGNRRITNEGGWEFILPSVVIPPNQSLYVMMGTGNDDLTFAKGYGLLFTGSRNVFEDRGADQCGYYAGPHALDFVAWGGEALAEDDTAVAAGIWTNGTWVPVVQNAREIFRVGPGPDTNGILDWSSR